MRIGRVSEENRIYLITSVTHNRNPFFENLETGRILVRSMQYFHTIQRVNSMAYVVMPDHVHWLFQLNVSQRLDSLMCAFKGYTSLKICRHLNAPGIVVWQAGYHDHAIRIEEDVKSVARYIVANPLRAGLVNKIGDYPLWDAAWL